MLIHTIGWGPTGPWSVMGKNGSGLHCGSTRQQGNLLIGFNSKAL